MFEHNSQKDGSQESGELPTRLRLPGCSLWGAPIWIQQGISILFWFGNPLKGELRVPPQISYSTFRQQVKTGYVDRVTVQGEQIPGEFMEPAHHQPNLGAGHIRNEPYR
jgi:hypothetical protein